jgi:hypothetical protein
VQPGAPQREAAGTPALIIWPETLMPSDACFGFDHSSTVYGPTIRNVSLPCSQKTRNLHNLLVIPVLS